MEDFYKLVAEYAIKFGEAVLALAGVPAEPAQEPTLEDVRTALVRLTQSGQRDKARAIVLKYGSDMSSIDPSHYADMLKEAQDA